MKGLFIKDLRLLKGQKSFFGAVLVVMAVFMTVYSSFSFVISYITVMTGMLTLTTISYDEYENGMRYLFTLPVSRKEYVAEKYLFSILITLSGLAVVSVAAMIVSRIRNMDLLLEEWILSVIFGFLIITVTLALLIPLHLKFGADKARVAMMIVVGAVILTACLGMKICDAFGIDWMGAVDKIAALRPAVSLAGLAGICGILMLISYLFALRFVGKREF